MTKHKISRRDFLAALAAGTVAATACGLHRTFAEASHTFEYWVLNRELSFRRTREGIIYSCEGYPLTDGETSSPGFDNQTLDPAFDWFLGRNFGDPDNGFGLRHILYDTLYDPQLGTNGYGQPVCLSLSQPLQDLVYYQLPPKDSSFGVGRCFTIVRQSGETKAWAENSLSQSVNDLLFYYCPAVSYSSGANVLCNASGALEIVTTAALLEYDIPFAPDASAEEKAALAAEALDSSCYCDVLRRYLAPEGLLCPLPNGALLQTDGGFLFNDEDLATQEAFRAAYSRIANGAVLAACCCPCCGSKALRMAACVFSLNALRRTIFGAQSMARPRPTALGRSGCRKKNRHSWPKCSGTGPSVWVYVHPRAHSWRLWTPASAVRKTARRCTACICTASCPPLRPVTASCLGGHRMPIRTFSVMHSRFWIRWPGSAKCELSVKFFVRSHPSVSDFVHEGERTTPESQGGEPT